MHLFRENRVLSIIFIVIIALIIITGGYLGYVQSSGIPEVVGQTAPSDLPETTILEGTYVCLPHTDGTKPKECTPGIQTKEKDYYALDMQLVIAAGANPKLTNGMKISAGGVVVPIEAISTDQWKIYPIKGIMQVEEVAKQ